LNTFAGSLLDGVNSAKHPIALQCYLGQIPVAVDFGTLGVWKTRLTAAVVLHRSQTWWEITHISKCWQYIGELLVPAAKHITSLWMGRALHFLFWTSLAN